eukprot:gene11717-85_t
MVNSCIVMSCANRQTKESKLGFYRLPKKPNRRRLWLVAIHHKKYNPPLGNYVGVCGKHFISVAASSDSRSPDYVPALEMGYEKTFGGRVSDKVITQRSGFLDLLEYNDHVLADRGFLVADDVANHNATLVIPAFTKGKDQLSQQDVKNRVKLQGSLFM